MKKGKKKERWKKGGQRREEGEKQRGNKQGSTEKEKEASTDNAPTFYIIIFKSKSLLLLANRQEVQRISCLRQVENITSDIKLKTKGLFILKLKSRL